MTERKAPKPATKSTASLVRSSAAEYLTFIAASGQGGCRGGVCRREHLGHADTATRHHRSGLQGQFRARCPIPQMSHGCKFYQKIIDINATAIDHDVTVKATSCMKAGKSKSTIH